MSFSARVKEELSHQLSKARHCQIAELAAILSLCGKIHIDEEDHFSIRIHTENVEYACKVRRNRGDIHLSLYQFCADLIRGSGKFKRVRRCDKHY